MAVQQDPMSGGSGDMYSEVKCIMDNGHMGHCSLSHEQTDTTENITFLQPHWQTVISIERSSSGRAIILRLLKLFFHRKIHGTLITFALNLEAISWNFPLS